MIAMIIGRNVSRLVVFTPSVFRKAKLSIMPRQKLLFPETFVHAQNHRLWNEIRSNFVWFTNRPTNARFHRERSDGHLEPCVARLAGQKWDRLPFVLQFVSVR